MGPPRAQRHRLGVPHSGQKAWARLVPLSASLDVDLRRPAYLDYHPRQARDGGAKRRARHCGAIRAVTDPNTPRVDTSASYVMPLLLQLPVTLIRTSSLSFCWLTVTHGLTAGNGDKLTTAAPAAVDPARDNQGDRARPRAAVFRRSARRARRSCSVPAVATSPASRLPFSRVSAGLKVDDRPVVRRVKKPKPIPQISMRQTMSNVEGCAGTRLSRARPPAITVRPQPPNSPAG